MNQKIMILEFKNVEKERFISYNIIKGRKREKLWEKVIKWLK